MASIPATTPDTIITLKVNIEGSNRRFKLPLRDLGASSLPDKLRYLLAIPPTSEAIFERYSDSAAAFVVLDAANPSVYKQLYRAAKAKLKLRLKVTITDKEPVMPEPVMPKPATVEDEELAPVKPEVQPTIRSQILWDDAAAGTDTQIYGRLDNADAGRDMQEFVSPENKDFTDAGRDTQDSAEKEKEIHQAIPWTSVQQSFDELSIGTGAAHPSCGETKRPAIQPMSTCEPTSQSHLSDPGMSSPEQRERFYSLYFPREERDRPVHICKPSAFTLPKSAPPACAFSVYCNNCSMSIPDVHYHCSTCDDGDFDLCPSCNDSGVSCHGDHWLIKRIVDKGKYIHSTTETLAPKKQFADSKTTLVAPAAEEDRAAGPHTRTCNSCITEMFEEHFVTCTDCEDFDLCMLCHVGLKHGHNPKHAFAFVDEDVNHDLIARVLLAPGRNYSHSAVCDGCEKSIFGVRHKCLDCPDWDFCNSCIANASFIHPRHRFVPLYETMNAGIVARRQNAKVRHHGIFCDGPLCNRVGDSMSAYITGDRYKCAVCHDTDFCASCEASPSNPHNKTHPLIKFKTPVRNVSVTTLGDHPNGKAMPPMGDRRSDSLTTSKATETTPAQSINAATQVQTVAEVKPTEVKTEEPTKVEAADEVEKPIEVKEAAQVEEAVEQLSAPADEVMIAHFVRDVVADGTIMPPNTVFEQTWYLRNGGKTSWPAGCSVKFINGVNMCAVDPDHPASVHELVSAAESTICYTELAPGQEYGFTVLMRSPSRPGNYVSFWRTSTPDDDKFGHRLWCDITVNEPTPVIKKELSMRDLVDSAVVEDATVESDFSANAATTKAEGSQMIFPKLDKESPSSSVHKEMEEAQQAPEEVSAAEEIFDDDFEDFNQNLEVNEAEDGFMTDEEYDILDASDEEYLAEQESASKK
ncbi:ZZ type zinc finger domain-containing protein [Sclerotinia borealis F-4128]|uniref:ZZ type zinc finger domain-containing protein n=1 Tax=Sclerotinia borealis (strain F-4128) TaxID=1432307 RepID=W9C3Q9_SCLBF|nr:ZZ type zinc finger domain-containing protein [Sclerotinia borealis F-4128]